MPLLCDVAVGRLVKLKQFLASSLAADWNQKSTGARPQLLRQLHTKREFVSSFLTAHQHIIGYSVPEC